MWYVDFIFKSNNVGIRNKQPSWKEIKGKDFQNQKRELRMERERLERPVSVFGFGK